MPTVYELGPFRLDTEARVLTLGGVATPLGARGVAVLAALVRRAGEYVEKSVIVHAAWPGLVVEEANLTVQISAIRRVLGQVPQGKHWIETLARRGYRFVGPVARLDESHATTARASDGPSIAVLPFVNLSRDPDDEYFSEGLAEELLDVLAKIRGLRVAARTSAFQFKGRNDDIAFIGRKLNVATLLEGSVRKFDNRLRISVRLVNVADGYHIWSETYDRAFDDIFAVQDDITQSVVRELRATVLGIPADTRTGQQISAQVADAARGRATHPEAHRLFLQGRYLGQRHNRDDNAKSIGYLKQALALDARFAGAWAELGGRYLIEADMGWTSIADGYAQAREALTRALALEPDLAEAHALMAWVQTCADWDWRGAGASCRRALALAPGNAVVINVAGNLAMQGSRLEEAIELFHEALLRDPLRATVYVNLGNAMSWSGRAAEAEIAYRKAIELAPQRSVVHSQLALLLSAQGRGAEARAEVLLEPEELNRLGVLAIVDHAENRIDESDAALQALIAKYQDPAAYGVATVYAARNEPDLAFEWLERAYLQRDPGITDMKVEPLLRSLHADTRWERFLRKIGLAD